MTTVPPIIDEAETLVRELATALTRVHPGECLCCYLARQLTQSPCDETHRHAVRYRDAAAPRATALQERLGRIGAYCDCELFLNGYEVNPGLGSADPSLSEVELVTPVRGTGAFALPSCLGVRRGSLRPCTNWVRLRR